MKQFSSCAAVLVDQVNSRATDRRVVHALLLDAIEATNEAVPPLDGLRVTVGDEMQAVYATLGEALRASYHLRGEIGRQAELRFGIGLGDIEVIDTERGIQDGSAWWRAREAIEEVERIATEPSTRSLRTGIHDERASANPLTIATVRLVDAHLAHLRDGAREALHSLLSGHDNRTAAELAGISPSANSQRVINNDLRILAEAIETLSRLP